VICHARAAGDGLRFRCARIKPHVSQLTTTFYGSRRERYEQRSHDRNCHSLTLSLSLSLSLFLSFSASRRNVNCIRETEVTLCAFADSVRAIPDSITFDSPNRDFLSLSLSLSLSIYIYIYICVCVPFRQRGNYGSFLLIGSFGNFAMFRDGQQSSHTMRVICRE